MIRQGDILLVPVTHTPHLDFFLYGPSGVQMTPDDFAEAAVVERVVLTEGEATGHQHVMLGDLRVMRKPWFGQERMVIWVRRGAITHPDHDPTPRPIPPGWYEVIRQRVFSPEGLNRGAGAPTAPAPRAALKHSGGSKNCIEALRIMVQCRAENA